MDGAKLNEEIVNIRSEARLLELQGYHRQEVAKALNDRYRMFSKKGNFRCICCDEPVVMVLSEGDREYFFRHFKERSCSFSENYKRHEAQVQKHENPVSHNQGLTVIRTILEGQLKPLGITVTSGYQLKHELSIIPDLLLHFPDGRIGAVDFLTGLRKGASYARWIDKRQAAYESHGIIPFNFVDAEYLAYRKETQFIGLVEGEQQLLKLRMEDSVYSLFLEQLAPQLQEVLLEKWGTLTVHSLAYLNPMERQCTIIRLLHKDQNGFVVNNPLVHISLERALTLNEQQTDFLLYDESETDIQLPALQDAVENLYLDKMVQEEEKRQREEEERRRQEDLERRRQELEQRRLQAEAERRAQEGQKPKQYWPWGESDNKKSDIRSQAQMDADLKRENAKLDRSWKQQKSEGNEMPVKQSTQRSTSYDPQQRRREQLTEEILNTRVIGETYIDGEAKAWKTFVLKKFMSVFRADKTIEQLLDEMKQAGFSFNQHDNLIQHTLAAYLEIIGKKSGKPWTRP